MLALMLTLGVCRPVAAQTTNRPFADLGRYLQTDDAIVMGDREAAVDSQAPVVSLSALSLRVKPGDTLSVRVTSGEEVAGTFSGASASSLTLVVDGQSREIPAGAVQQVVLRRGRNRLRLGLLIAAPLGAYIGSSNCYRVDTSRPPPSCGASILGGAAIGGGIGALTGSTIWRPVIVYVTPAGTSAAPIRDAANVRPSIELEAPVGSLSALASRVLPFERIYVRTISGAEIVGRFSRASGTSLAVEVGGRTLEIPASDVQQVWRRGENRVRKGMLFGFLAGASLANLIFVSGGGTGFILPATVVGGGTGLMWGALIGAFVHERPLVYRATVPTVRVTPVLTPDRFGVMASIHF
jgi:hypothetical protein